jgi:hypothetical protein
MSGERIPYHLRPNKFVERALFLEVLGQVNSVQPIDAYLYVGFGGPYLEDFKVLHQHFGIKHMLSLEQEEWVYKRQKFNIPYSCVRCRHQSSAEFISSFDDTIHSYGRNRRVLIWLDYAAANELRAQLEEIRALIPRLQPYDMLKVTLNANPAVLGLGQDHGARLARLRERLGDLLPEGVTESNMTHAGYPNVVLRTVELVAKTAAGETRGLTFQPLANYVYADTHQMLTVTGIMLQRDRDREFLRQARFKSADLVSTNWKDFHRIEVPFLSVREKLLLDVALFTRGKAKQPARSVSKKLTLGETAEQTRKLIKAYGEFYRFYPHYHRVYY